MPTASVMTAPDPLEYIKIYNQPDCTLPKSFFEGRFIPNLHPDSLDYEQWWSEQLRRCEEGWKDGGYCVTPIHYYHLNFKKINMVDVSVPDGPPILEHPYFSYEDQELFNDIHECKISKEGIFLVTGRGWGKSFLTASVAEHEFTFKTVSECIVSASTKPYADRLWEKIEMGLNTQPTEIKRAILASPQDTIQSGYEDREELTNQFRVYDDQSYLRKVIYDSDPEKTRGTRPNMHIFEEVGSWTGAASLLDCFKKTEASWRRGKYKTTFPMYIGTGGAMDTGGSIDAKMMFENPIEYGCKAYKYGDNHIGKFYPAYVKFGGFYEKSGQSDTIGAKEHLDEIRATKKPNPDLYRQETSEFPYNPAEAFQTSGHGVFPMDILERQYVRLERDLTLKKMVQRGNLEWVREGSKIIGVTWEVDDENGIFEIVEHPEWTKKSWTLGKMANLYIAGCDSFDAVAEDTTKLKKFKGEARRIRKSRGANYIYKRFANNLNITSRLFVARIVQRTDDATEFYWNTIKLNMYYNAEVLIEYTKIGILQHYITNGYERMLYKRPHLDSTIIKESVSTNKYGVAMPIQTKRHVVSLLAQYVKTDCDQIFFASLLRDMMLFTYEGLDKNDHDDTMGAAICMLGDDDLWKRSVRQVNPVPMAWPTWYRDPSGKLTFGVKEI